MLYEIVMALPGRHFKIVDRCYTQLFANDVVLRYSKMFPGVQFFAFPLDPEFVVDYADQ